MALKLLSLFLALACAAPVERSDSPAPETHLAHEELDRDARAAEAWDRSLRLTKNGQTARLEGRFNDAEQALRHALVVAESQYGLQSLEWSHVANALALTLADMGDYSSARTLHERTLAIWEQQLGPEHPHTARGLNNLAQVLKALGEYAAARPLFERALSILEKQLGPEDPLTSIALNNLAGLLHTMGDYARARPLYERCLALREQHFGPDHAKTADILNNLGLLAHDSGDYTVALTLYERALAIQEKELGPDHPVTATTLANLGRLLADAGDYAAARPLYERALAIREDHLDPEHPDTANDMNSLAYLFHRTGDYAAARPLYERALEIVEKRLGPSHPHTARGLNNLAGLLQDMGDDESARPLYERALAINEQQLGPEHPVTATSLNNVAVVLERTGNHVAARHLYERALALRQERLGDDHPSTANSLSNLASLLEDMGDHAKARSLYERALTIHQRQLGPDHPDTALSLSNLAWLAVNTGEGSREKARFRFERAASIAKATGARAIAWVPLGGAGRLSEQEGQWPDAVRYYRDAIAALEEMRTLVGSDAAQTTYMRDKLWVYEALQRVLSRLHEEKPQAGHDKEMFAVAEQARARALLEMLGEARSQIRKKAPQDWQDRHLAAIRTLNSAQNALLRRGPGDPDSQEQLRRLQDAEAELDRLEAELRRLAPEIASIEAPQPASIRDIQSGALRSGEALLAYALGEEESFLYLVTRDQYRVLELPATSLIRELVERLGLGTAGHRIHASKLDPAWLSGIARDRLYETLLEPALATLPAGQQLIIVPDGALFYLPFELLGDLLDKHTISYQPSASVLFLSRQRIRNPNRPSALLAMAPFAAETVAQAAFQYLSTFTFKDWRRPDPLPYTGDELKSIRALYENDELVSMKFGAAANESVLKSDSVRRYTNLHLATHAFANPEAPRRSSVVLSQENLDPDDDGLLTLYELFGLELDADLVVLSACETGLGRLEKGEGMVGLTRGFLYAGTRSLVVSLWNVNDQATAIFMERFYRGMLEEGLSKAEALRQAKLSFINEEDTPALRHPHYWAAFILVGEAN